MVRVLKSISCNACGCDIPIKSPDFITIEKDWSYLSNKKMSHQVVDLCESCWDKICSSFVTPPSVIDRVTLECSDDEKSPQLSLFDEYTLNGYSKFSVGRSL